MFLTFIAPRDLFYVADEIIIYQRIYNQDKITSSLFKEIFVLERFNIYYN